VTRTRMLSASIKEYDLEFKRPVREAFSGSSRASLPISSGTACGDGSFRLNGRDTTALMVIVTLRARSSGILTGDVRRPKDYGQVTVRIISEGIRSKNHA